MAVTYTIYHVVGIKVGATYRFHKRCRENKREHGQHVDIEVICKLPEATQETARAVELWWQHVFGYEARGFQPGPARPLSDVTKQRMSVAASNRVVHSMTGRTHSAETRAKMSAKTIGRKFSAEHRAAISAAQQGLTRKPLSAETKAKLTGRPRKLKPTAAS